MKTTIVAALMIAVAVPAFAGDWAYVSSGENVRIGMDRATIRRSGDIARAWVVTVYPSLQTLAQHRFDYRVELRSFDCSERTQRVNYMALYTFGSGQTNAQDMDSGALRVIPDTTGDYVLMAACDPTIIAEPFYESSADLARDMVEHGF